MNRRNWLPTTLIALVMGLALVWGCSDDDNPADPGGGDPGDDAFGTITGVVHRTGGSVLAEATVTSGDLATTTNEEGYFVLTSVPEGSALVSIATTGYSSTFRMVAVSEGSSIHLADIVLVPVESRTIDGAAGGAAATGDGDGQVEFEAGSFVDAAGNPYTGDVTVELNAMLPGDGDFYGSFPG